MNPFKRFFQVSASPTLPGAQRRQGPQPFDVADLYRGPVTTGTEAGGEATACDEKLRKAYFWIANHAIINPFHDIAFNDRPPTTFAFGDSKVPVELPTEQSYSSYILLPLLTLVLRRRCLLVGGPGRGKTAIAVLMGRIAGYGLDEVRRGIQHGHPQMTVADLLGNPLPASLMKAETGDEIRVAWRRWLGMRVKVIDEYNRIPTRTQSALLTVLADGYAEMYDQLYQCPESAWYLTANDDAGGGTYQVIEALRDRIDVVVKALHFNSRFLDELLTRVEEGVRPEEAVPGEIIFTQEELDRAAREIRAVPMPTPLLRRLAFFTSQFELCEPAARQIDYLTKDTVKSSGVDLAALIEGQTGLDRLAELGMQTLNGLSVRALMTALAYCKAMAWFRGGSEVAYADLVQVLPFVLHDKLAQHAEARVFSTGDGAALRSDRVTWIRRLFDAACAEYDRLDRDHDDPAAAMLDEFARGLDGVDEKTARARLTAIERQLRLWTEGRKLNGHLFDDVLALKYLHQRYTNYLRWLTWRR
ncbi:MAG TPA: AAA family ATPase [Planctomycetota bacterium]|nr:AAA family ATPase [Planctomycetota bacterium]